MNEHEKGLSLNGAPSQYDRWLRTADAASVKVDGRTFSELLSFAAPFGGLLNFYDLENHPAGNWTPFFLTDPTMILAALATMDVRMIDRRFSGLWRSAANEALLEHKQESLRDLLRFVVDIARKLDSWLSVAHLHPRSRPARLFAGEASSWISNSLSAQLRQLKAEVEHAASSGLLASGPSVDFKGFQPIWGLSQPVVMDAVERAETLQKQIDAAAIRLSSIFRVFLEVLLQLQKFAKEHLPETLRDSDHKPQIALYIAFARLFRSAQRTMNTITARFAQFYYRGILKESNAGLIPDKVYLTFALDPKAGVDATTVPAGTQFPAGLDANGAAILYVSTQDLSVSAATLELLRTLRVVSGPLYTAVSSPPGSPDAVVQSPQTILATEINVALMNDEAQGKVPDGGPIPWTTFGESTTGESAIATTTPAVLGFAISSMYLMLTGGDRVVTLTFNLGPQGQLDLEAALEILAATTGEHPESIFAQTLESAFDLYLSTTGGWFLVGEYTGTASPNVSPLSPSAFSISFTLPASGPPITGFDPTQEPVQAGAEGPDDLNPAPAVPTLKAYLRQTPVIVSGSAGTVSIYPLALLAGLYVDWIEIRTSTANLSDLQIVTSTGQVDKTSPFPVFGGVPVTGSFIQIGNPELFVKRPEDGSLRLSLQWFGLPANDNGFAGYYRDYVLGLDGQPSPAPLFDNQVFRGEFRIVNPGSWDLIDSPQPWAGNSISPETYLFRTQDSCSSPTPDPATSLCEVTTFENLELIDTRPPAYYDPATGAIRLTLTEPPYSFGNVLYASNVLNATIADLPQVDKGALSARGCKPLSDAADSLSVIVQQTGGTSSSARSTAIKQSQEALIQSAKAYLSQSLSQITPDGAEWTRSTFSTPASKAPAYRAQVVSGRLRAALRSIETSTSLTSPPELPQSAAVPIRKSVVMLQAVVWMQQCLDSCAAEPEGSRSSCIQNQLVACQQKLRQAYSDCSQDSPQMNYPNAPWLPQAQSMTVSYAASCGFAPASSENSAGNYFYLLPFAGYAPADESLGGLAGTPLLCMPESGNLELGFSGLDSAQNLDLLFQMSAGRGGDSQAVVWQYLNGNSWVDLTSAQVPSDTTNGLLNTGILTLGVPSSDSADAVSTVAESGYRWLRAVTGTPEQFPDTIGIYPHVSVATWDASSGSSGSHLNQPLPPYTISSSVPTLAPIKLIDQPIESFGGRPRESDKAFHARMAERLRHKNRAILGWDYEQLVLERFPAIWKVHALPAMGAQGESAPGAVLVVVIAGPGGVQVADPTEPLVTAQMVEEVREYLASLASPFASIQVVNPVYVRVKVFAEVGFKQGGTDADAGAGVDRLNSDLIEYLSPWFYDAERASKQGNYASEDAISQFIQNQSYVETLIRLRLEHAPSPETLSWYFLTSAESHKIETDATFEENYG